MSRVNHKRVKQLLNEKRSKITDRQFFSSRILAGHYEDLAAAQTRRYHYNKRIRVNLFWNARNPSAACTDNNSIIINTGNPIVTKVRGREKRYQIVTGMFATNWAMCSSRTFSLPRPITTVWRWDAGIPVLPR